MRSRLSYFRESYKESMAALVRHVTQHGCRDKDCPDRYRLARACKAAALCFRKYCLAMGIKPGGCYAKKRNTR